MSEKRTFPSYRLYKDKAGEWRWTYNARNGNAIAQSSEGYVRKDDAERSIEIMKESVPAPVWFDEGDAATTAAA